MNHNSNTRSTSTEHEQNGVRHANKETTSPNAELPTVTDGGTAVRSYDEVRSSSDAVRSYSADGTLYAYGEEDVHVIVSRGHDSRDRWTKRVPDTRTEASEGDTLWTIPENWILRCRNSGSGHRKHAIYTIPELGLDVEVSIPNKTHLRDATFQINRVGTIQIDVEVFLHKPPLITYLDEYEDQLTTELVDALATIVDQWETFVTTARAHVQSAAETVVADGVLDSYPALTLQHWTTDPWADTVRIEEALIELAVDREIRSDVTQILKNINAFVTYPGVTVRVKSTT